MEELDAHKISKQLTGEKATFFSQYSIYYVVVVIITTDNELCSLVFESFTTYLVDSL